MGSCVLHDITKYLELVPRVRQAHRHPYMWLQSGIPRLGLLSPEDATSACRHLSIIERSSFPPSLAPSVAHVKQDALNPTAASPNRTPPLVSIHLWKMHRTIHNIIPKVSRRLRPAPRLFTTTIPRRAQFYNLDVAGLTEEQNEVRVLCSFFGLGFVMLYLGLSVCLD